MLGLTGKGQRRRALMRRAAIATGLGAVFAAGTFAVLWQRLLRRPLPQTKGTISIGDITAPIEIARDRWGVPHVTAQTDEDLWFGQGFCHGQDRLWQMDFYRRITAGRLAEIAGEEGLPAHPWFSPRGLPRVAGGGEA